MTESTGKKYPLWFFSNGVALLHIYAKFKGKVIPVTGRGGP
jgi:hypothetical protein